MSEMLKTVRNFIDCMKANPATRKQFKTKNSGDIGKTMLVEMEIDTGNHPP